MESSGRIAMENRASGERVGRGPQVLYDNGAYYLFVDAQCNYWVNNPWQVWDESRSGTLDATTALRLGESLRLNAWPDVEGVWTDTAQIFDAPLLVFDDATVAVRCEKLCDAPDVPKAVKDMRDAFPEVTEELWNGGVAATSAIRAIAVLTDPNPTLPFVDWPLTRPITDFLRTDEVIEFGQGVLEDNVDSVRVLKDLRASFLRGDHGTFPLMIPLIADGTHYELYLRDTLPFEDATGIVPLSVDLTDF